MERKLLGNLHTALIFKVHFNTKAVAGFTPIGARRRQPRGSVGWDARVGVAAASVRDERDGEDLLLESKGGFELTPHQVWIHLVTQRGE